MYPTDQTAELTPILRTGKLTLQEDSGVPVPVRPEKTAELLTDLPTRDERTVDAAAELWRVGALINDRYLLERRLGVGAMGEVFLARDRLLKKHVALKVLRTDLAKSRATVRRFLREVALAHSVTHPNVVRIYDTGEAHGLPYFSMEYLQGQTLDELIDTERREGDNPPMTIREIRDVSYEILSGLEAAHQAGIVHRDLKPANVMLTHRGAIVMDFGVAGFDTIPTTPPDPGEAHSLVRTEAGTIFGSPAYMAPELWEGAPATIQSDLYSFGVMLYQMLSGKLPIDAANAREFLAKLQTTKPEPIRTRRKDTPWNLSLLVARCMASEPDQRPQSAHAAAALVAPLAKKWPRVAMASSVVIALVASVTALLESPEPWEERGLPDAMALRDLDAVIRSYDVGDHAMALAQLQRIEARAPHAASLAFWRATVEHDLGAETTRVGNCRSSMDHEAVGDGGEPWRGDELWISLASNACAFAYSIAPELQGMLAGDSTSLDEGFLAIATQYSLVPRVEAVHKRDSTVHGEAKEVLDRLEATPDLSGSAPLAVRWRLAEIDLLVALGRRDSAREEVELLLEDEPESPAAMSRASWLYDRIGERDRAQHWADEVADIDLRPRQRLQLDRGLLREVGEQVDAHAADPRRESMLAMWCGYAFRFEHVRPPPRCAELAPGLVHSLWRGGELSEVDNAAMSLLERHIIKRQQSLNVGDCIDRGEPSTLLHHLSPPFETYMTQLDISAALCAADPRSANLQDARQLVDTLVAVAPQDPWALLLQAQVDQAQGANALARSRRQLVAEQWRDADDDLPLVRRLRASVSSPASEESAVERTVVPTLAPVEAAPGGEATKTPSEPSTDELDGDGSEATESP